MRKWKKKVKAVTTLTCGVECMDAPAGWEFIEGRLMLEKKFENFASAKNFVDAVSELAENENHHPDIHFGWGYVVLELFTHDEQKVTELDLELAVKINSLDVK